jgi:hypothetical protein
MVEGSTKQIFRFSKEVKDIVLFSEFYRSLPLPSMVAQRKRHGFGISGGHDLNIDIIERI